MSASAIPHAHYNTLIDLGKGIICEDIFFSQRPDSVHDTFIYQSPVNDVSTMSKHVSLKNETELNS
jgi:hypothetical protein